VIVGAVVLAAGAAAYVALGTSVVGVSHVDIRGAGYVGDDAIRVAAAISPNAPLLGLDTGAVARRVEAIPAIAHADVSRRLPSTIVIDVRLRVAVAAVPLAGPATNPASTGDSVSKAAPAPPAAYRLVDRTGVVFRTVSRRPSELPIIEVTSPGPQDGSTLGALAVLASLPASLRDDLDHITAPAPAEIALTLKDGREVVWGDATDNATKASVAVSLLHHSGEVIDVSAPNLVTVR
jgi:cell division protein FtsQ